MTTQARRLFLSYGRADASDLAERLARDLEQSTANEKEPFLLWRDRPEIRAGLPFMDQIAEALRNVDGVVALMSPHSVRTRATAADASDSVCLDEISYARFGAHKPIVPAMAVLCEPPLEIFRLDYVDFTNWDDEQRYHEALRKLIDGIAAALRGETRYRRWDDRLQPWDFGSFLARKREGFTGREWLFDEIRMWTEDASAAPMLIVGDPGIGKSALVAELVHRNFEGRVLAYHCCQSNVPETLRPGRFVRSIAAMIASRHPKYEELLDLPLYRDLLAPANCDNDPESAFDEGVLAALHRVGSPEGGRRLLVVDALDEALLHSADVTPGFSAPSRARGDVTIVRLLAERLDRFPHWLALVATSRDEAAVVDESLASLNPRVLKASHDRNLKDLRKHITDRLAAPPLAALLARSGESAEWVVKTLAERAEGNFLYARQALEAIERKILRFDEIGQLPPGLKQQYLWFFDRQFSTPGRWAGVEPLLEVLVAAQEPIAESDLSAATGLDVNTALPQALASLGQYLRGASDDPPRLEIFHKSLIEWLTDRTRRGNPYFVNRTSGHRRLAEGLYARYHANRLDLSPYVLRHLAAHMAEAARGAEPAQRVALQEELLSFVLDDLVQQQRLNDPLGLDISLGLALQVSVGGAPAASVPIVFEAALGRQAFLCDRLDARRLFQLAREGALDAFERELQLYPADDHWSAAARLVAAWLGIDRNRAGADQLREAARSHTVLDERVDAVFENRPPAFSELADHPSDGEVAEILRQVGGLDSEPVNPSMLWDQAAPPPPGRGMDPEGARYLAEFHAPVLVAYAQDWPVEGTQRVRDYVAVNAANTYRVYRVGSLWHILQAVARHRNPQWVIEMAPDIIAAALAGRDRDAVAALDVTLRALHAAATDRLTLDASMQELASEVQRLEPPPGRNDSWGVYRRALGALAEGAHVLRLGDPSQLLLRALAVPAGYAGFQAPSCLTLAESISICAGAAQQIDEALRMAHVAAQNVQDLVFCTRTVGRVNAMVNLWRRPIVNEADLSARIDRFVANCRAAEFSACHVVGEIYPERRTVNPTSRLPDWLLKANTLADLARAYDWCVTDFVAVNPEVESSITPLAEGTSVRVPDPRWAPQLASFFASLVLRGQFFPDERVRLILKLVPTTTGNPGDRTALATMLGRLLLALRPCDETTLSRLDHAFARYGGADRTQPSGFGAEPIVF